MGVVSQLSRQRLERYWKSQATHGQLIGIDGTCEAHSQIAILGSIRHIWMLMMKSVGAQNLLPMFDRTFLDRATEQSQSQSVVTPWMTELHFGVGMIVKLGAAQVGRL